MRKLLVLVLGIPVVVAVYVTAVLRRSVAARVAVALTVGAIAGFLAIGTAAPAPTTAVPASTPRVPIAADFSSSVRTGLGLVDPIAIEFSAPMDPASVAGALRVRPAAAVSMSWSDDRTLLVLRPVEHWLPTTLYTVVVSDVAGDGSGDTLRSTIRAAFLTADAGTGTSAVSEVVGARASLDTAFTVVLDRPVDPAVLRRALRTAPVVDGDLEVSAVPDGGQRVTFRPASPLAPDTAYRLWFEGLVDADGVPFADPPTITLQTAPAPAVVRFRPAAASTGVDRAAAVSVRFTETMDRSSTAAAFHVAAGGTDVAGKVSWAEGDTVLVFRPATPFAYDAHVIATVDAAARSEAGAPLRAASAAFTVEPKPVVRTPAPKPAPAPVPKPSGGGGAVSGTWTAVETYYLGLMNCTRTGGWVTSTGSCSSPGGRDVAPLKLDSGISTKVSRPYAKLLATRNLCSHFVGGNPGDRLRAAGYTSYRWGENLGCRSGDPYDAVLGSHLYFQAEKPTNGGHYVNLMNSAYDRAGIGVWVYAGRVRLVVDFYHP